MIQFKNNKVVLILYNFVVFTLDLILDIANELKEIMNDKHRS